LEISFLNKEQVETWQHPSLYDFHYSEGWRVRYEEELSAHESHFLKEGKKTDPDLAAHVTITNHRGICIEGPSIIDLFPAVTRSHYVSSIMSDYEDCLRNIEADPVYCVLNLIRVKWYLKEG
jgi:streptomycin 3"-adenylyltransferase